MFEPTTVKEGEPRKRGRQKYEEGFGVYTPTSTPTQEVYGGFELAFDHFNETLFEDILPPCLITLQRKPNLLGYFSPDQHIRQGSIEIVDEIALNPDHFRSRTDREILAVLVHEMAHLWQHHFGKPGRAGSYHNKEWAEKMKSIGLYPSDTEKPGGKETGEKMGEYIILGGRFDVAANKIEWVDTPPELRSTLGHSKQRRGGKRTKYTCPKCGLNAWSRAGARLRCEADQEVMQTAQ